MFGALRHNPVLAARYTHLTGRAEHTLTDAQARVALAAALLRQLQAVITTRTPWDPAIAAGLTPATGRPDRRGTNTRAPEAPLPPDRARAARAGRARHTVGTRIPRSTLGSPARLPTEPG